MSTASWTAGAAEVGQRVERGADRSAGEQHVVDQDNGLAVDALGRDLGQLEGADAAKSQVVAVHRGVEGADRHVAAFDRGDLIGDPAGQRDAAGRDAEHGEPLGTVIAFDDFVGDAGERAGEVRRVEDGTGERSPVTGRVGLAGKSASGAEKPESELRSRHRGTPLSASQDGIKGR